MTDLKTLIDRLEVPDDWDLIVRRSPSLSIPDVVAQETFRNDRIRRAAIAALSMGVAAFAILFLIGAFETSPPPMPPLVGSGSCANIAIFEGEEYTGRNATVHPVAGDVLGEARVPACKDPNTDSLPADEFVKVARLEGVDREIAIVDAVAPEVIYVNSSLDSLPPEVERYFHAPVCLSADAPVELHGTWLGIIGPGETTELDLVPPYTVEMLVTRSSSSAYLDAEIVIEVPQALGKPLTRDDVKTSLWEAGTLDVRATCAGDRFIAESIAASPP